LRYNNNYHSIETWDLRPAVFIGNVHQWLEHESDICQWFADQCMSFELQGLCVFFETPAQRLQFLLTWDQHDPAE